MECQGRRLDKLIAYTDLMTANLSLIQGLNEAQIQRLQALSPELKAMGRQLEALELPYSLVHGDFYAGNIATDHNKILIFD